MCQLIEMAQKAIKFRQRQMGKTTWWLADAAKKKSATILLLPISSIYTLSLSTLCEYTGSSNASICHRNPHPPNIFHLSWPHRFVIDYIHCILPFTLPFAALFREHDCRFHKPTHHFPLNGDSIMQIYLAGTQKYSKIYYPTIRRGGALKKHTHKTYQMGFVWWKSFSTQPHNKWIGVSGNSLANAVKMRFKYGIRYTLLSLQRCHLYMQTIYIIK